MTADEFIEEVEAGRPLYYNKLIDGRSPLQPVLYDVYPFAEFSTTGQMKKTTAHFWWGAAGIRSTPHYDQSQNFFVQVLITVQCWPIGLVGGRVLFCCPLH